MDAVGTGASLRRFPLGLRRPSSDAAVMAKPARVAMVNAFSDDGHLRYYGLMSVSCGLKEEKRRKKMVKGLEKNLLALGELGLGVVGKDELKDQIFSEAADLLLAQLTKLRTEAKELKKKRKQEKAAAKAARMKNCRDESSSSSSSESSDSECESVVKMNSLKTVDSPTKSESKPCTYADPITAALKTENVIEEAKSRIVGAGSCCASSPPPVEKIEVCMGGKCKKLGAMELMAEFEKKIAMEGAVVGCKCMGKCRDGPNVRVVNRQSGEDGSAVRASKVPLCIGVGLEDVGSIVSNFFGEKDQDVGLLAA